MKAFQTSAVQLVIIMANSSIPISSQVFKTSGALHTASLQTTPWVLEL